MNKALSILINSIIFIIGIGSIVLKLPILCAACLLAGALLFIWCSNINPNGKADAWGFDIEDLIYNEDPEQVELSQKIQELSEANSRLISENQRLMVEIENKKMAQLSLFHPLYLCPLTGSLPINLNDFFTTYIYNHSSVLERQGLHSEYDCGVPEAETYLSSSALTIICDNIFDNILKFSSDHDSVYIRITDKDNDSLVIFRNGGRGVKEDELGKVFEMNFQGSNRKTGNGLGLSQVKAIMDDFGGQVWGKSSPNNGFALYLQIPKNQKQI